MAMWILVLASSPPHTQACTAPGAQHQDSPEVGMELHTPLLLDFILSVWKTLGGRLVLLSENFVSSFSEGVDLEDLLAPSKHSTLSYTSAMTPG